MLEILGFIALIATKALIAQLSHQVDQLSYSLLSNLPSFY